MKKHPQTKTYKPYRSCKKTFTLIELLIVIAIIAVLAGMLLPALASVKKNVLKTMCGSNQKQISLALLAYTADYNDYFPWATTYNVKNTDGKYIEGVYPGYFIENNILTRKIMLDPANPNQKLMQIHQTNYGINGALAGESASDAAGAGRVIEKRKSRPYTVIRKPSQLVMLGDAGLYGSPFGTTSVLHADTTGHATWKWPLTGHDDKCYTLMLSFADGHFKSFSESLSIQYKSGYGTSYYWKDDYFGNTGTLTYGGLGRVNPDAK